MAKKSVEWEVKHGECVPILEKMPRGSVDLLFVDPPFNIDYNAYDTYDDSKKHDEYLDECRVWINQCLLVLKPTGSLWLAIGDEYASELDVMVKSLLPACGKRGWWKRSHVIWYYTFGVNCVDNFSRSHTHLLYYAHNNSQKRTFNKDDRGLRHPSARQLVYNDKRANPEGRLPDNTWILNPLDFDKAFSPSENTWLASRVAGTFHERAVRGTHGEQRGVPQMPSAVMDRVVRACAKPGDLVVDPMCGNGTTGEAAVRHGCRFVGIDVSEACVKMSRSRIEQAAKGGATKEGASAWPSGSTAGKTPSPQKKSRPSRQPSAKTTSKKKRKKLVSKR